MLETRIEKAILEGLFVGEQEESFRVHVEAAEREASGREVELFQRALTFVSGVGVELAEHTIGFVEGDEHWATMKE